MNGGGGYQGRRLTMAKTNDLRLEGIVIQKRLTRAEATRYLVMDMNAGSIAVYKNPPPKDDGLSGMDQRSKSMPAKILNSVSPRSFKRSTSDEGGKKSQSMYENLAHLSREPRYFSDPSNKKFKAVSGVTWVSFSLFVGLSVYLNIALGGRYLLLLCLISFFYSDLTISVSIFSVYHHFQYLNRNLSLLHRQISIGRSGMYTCFLCNIL